jgi:D-glycero-alpha-D-manno-heptose-7-phosphate kinase
MLSIFSPFRISLFGGGTDLQAFYEKFESNVVGFATTFGAYVTINTSKIHNRNTRFRIVYSKVENVNAKEEIQHPLVRRYVELMGLDEAEIHFDSDLPSVSGLGTSSAFANALSVAYFHQKQFSPTLEDVARLSIKVEREDLGEAGGIQDQVLSAAGGLNLISMSSHGWTVKPLDLPQSFINVLVDSIVLVRVGWRSNEDRQSHALEREKVQGANNIARLSEIRMLSNQGIDALKNQNLDGVGEVMNKIWDVKKSFSNVS